MEAYLQWVTEILKMGPDPVTVWAFVVGWVAVYGLDSLRAAIIRFGDKMPWRFGWLAGLHKEMKGYGSSADSAGFILFIYVCVALAMNVAAGVALAGHWEIVPAAGLAVGTGAAFYALHSLIFSFAKFGDWSLRGIGRKIHAGWNWVWETRARRRQRKADAKSKLRELEGDDIWQTFDALRKKIRELTADGRMFSSYAAGIDDFVDKRLLEPLEMRKLLKLGIPAVAPYASDWNGDGVIDAQEAGSIARKKAMEHRLAALDRQLVVMRESLAHKIPLIVDAQTRDDGGDMAKSALADLDILAAALDDTMNGDEMAHDLVAIADAQMRAHLAAAKTAGAPATEAAPEPEVSASTRTRST